MLLSKEQILTPSDLAFEDVEIEGGLIRVGEMSAYDRLSFEEATVEVKGNKTDFKVSGIDFVIELLLRCIINEDGDRVLGNEDRKALGRKSHKTLLKLFDAAKRVNGIGDDEVKDLEKNLEASQ